MMRVVLDTNVLVSAILVPRSIPARILQLILEGGSTFVISQDIIDEASRVLQYPGLVKLMKRNGVTPDELEVVIDQLGKIAVMTPGQYTADAIKDGPTDNIFLACAVEGEADFIISGDRHLTNLKEFQGITIVNPATFLSIVRREE
ncbi:MAG: putative toxin-antitoxin system toxin component, PIN family [Candidatus Latescibacter sp.]|nr:putative toxin-antitoxin system toxin component, PIN family [Candidatus Latescibacter sp.]